MNTQLHATASCPVEHNFAPTSHELLTFQLAGVNYAIDILKVQEIRAYEVPTRLPNVPHWVHGVLNLRGVIVPIIDLRSRLGLECVAHDAATVTIILTLTSGVVGAVVDSVRDVVDVPPSHIKPAPLVDVAVASSCITGIATLEQAGTSQMLVMLDINAVLAGTASAVAPHPVLQ